MDSNKDIIWKDIEGYEGLYKVSKYGLVKSVATTVRSFNGGFNRKNPRILQIQLSKDGYLIVCLTKNGKSKNLRLHRLVAIAFIPNPNNYPQVDHINAIKEDACYTNLRWCTAKMNTGYTVDTIGNTYRLRGERHSLSKLTGDNVREMRELYKTGNYRKRNLAKKYGVSESAINMAIKRKTWTHID